jgi:phosphatidate cytidylyltransferase
VIVSDAEPTKWIGAPLATRELVLRVLSALVLAPLAVAIAYVGGWPFVVFWGLAAAVVLWEWTSLVALADRRVVLMAGFAPLALAGALAGADRLLAGAIVAVMGAMAAAALAPGARRLWVAAGLPYAAAIALAPVALRADTEFGFLAVIFLYAVVWSTDIAAYFVGRAVGGPMLMPTVSPKKTWSGAIGGLTAAIAVAVVTVQAAGLTGWPYIVLVAVALSAVSQAGDLFESSLKRRFGAKDSSHLIPGHGGLMDRLDGFVAAAILAALIGLMRGGVEAPGRGLMMW